MAAAPRVYPWPEKGRTVTARTLSVEWGRNHNTINVWLKHTGYDVELAYQIHLSRKAAGTTRPGKVLANGKTCQQMADELGYSRASMQQAIYNHGLDEAIRRKQARNKETALVGSKPKTTNPSPSKTEQPLVLKSRKFTARCPRCSCQYTLTLRVAAGVKPDTRRYCRQCQRLVGDFGKVCSLSL